MYKINLNCDLGEGAAYDEQIIPLINSANIACGFHAGNHDMMEATAKLCIDNNVDIGAHPGYPDKEKWFAYVQEWKKALEQPVKITVIKK